SKRNKQHNINKVATFIEQNASIEDIEYHEDRRLNKDLILKLASGSYILDKHNIVLKGATGSGKSFLASAFGVSACRQFYKVKYIRLPELLDEFEYCGQIEPLMRSFEPPSAVNRASECGRKSHWNSFHTIPMALMLTSNVYLLIVLQ